jgi:hypothetical protein
MIGDGTGVVAAAFPLLPGDRSADFIACSRAITHPFTTPP